MEPIPAAGDDDLLIPLFDMAAAVGWRPTTITGVGLRRIISSVPGPVATCLPYAPRDRTSRGAIVEDPSCRLYRRWGGRDRTGPPLLRQRTNDRSRERRPPNGSSLSICRQNRDPGCTAIVGNACFQQQRFSKATSCGRIVAASKKFPGLAPSRCERIQRWPY